MANVKIRNVTYEDLPAVGIPKAVGTGDVFFYDTSGDTGVAADLRPGKIMHGAEGEVTGSMAEKSAATYHPSSSDQTINANQYLTGAQTVEAVTTTNLVASNIVAGVTVKVGSATDDDCVTSVAGSLQVPIISQDSVTKILYIS